MKKIRLSKNMTLDQFENGYWYARELKTFAKTIGIPSSSKLRKDELEPLIREYLRNGSISSPQRKNIDKTGAKDCELGLSLSLPVIHYTSNKETKAFIEAEAKKLDPTFKRRSGSRYRLNRWRDAQVTAGKKITYGDLVAEYVRLNKSDQPFAKIPTGRYINFLSDYLINEPKASRESAIKAWKELKQLDIPKEYTAWREFKSG